VGRAQNPAGARVASLKIIQKSIQKSFKIEMIDFLKILSGANLL
jgi:hypothetical protein